MLGIAAALLFYSGYYTVSTFYRYFGVQMSLLDLPAYTFPFKAHVLIVKALLIVISVIPLVLALELLYSRKRLTRPPKRPFRVWLWLIMYLVALGLVFFSFFS